MSTEVYRIPRLQFTAEVLLLGQSPRVSVLSKEGTTDELVAALSRDLTFEIGARLRAAVEVYGLQADQDKRARYEVSYWLLRSNQPVRQMRQDTLARAAVLSFDRERPVRGDVALEWVDVGTDRYEPGKYLLRVDITVGGRRIGRAQAAVTLVESAGR